MDAATQKEQNANMYSHIPKADHYYAERRATHISEFSTFPFGSKKTGKYANWPFENIKEPHENDVLYGRGGGTNHHPGNKRYRKMVEDRKVHYVNSKRLEKPFVALEIIKEWRSQEPPGRFLKLDDATGLWSDVGDKKAREKTSQALREKAPLLRKQQEEEASETSELGSTPVKKEENRKSVTYDVHPHDGRGQKPKMDRALLKRGHSLGVDYIKPGEEPIIDNTFSWEPHEADPWPENYRTNQDNQRHHYNDRSNEGRSYYHFRKNSEGFRGQDDIPIYSPSPRQPTAITSARSYSPSRRPGVHNFDMNHRTLSRSSLSAHSSPVRNGLYGHDPRSDSYGGYEAQHNGMIHPMSKFGRNLNSDFFVDNMPIESHSPSSYNSRQSSSMRKPHNYEPYNSIYSDTYVDSIPPIHDDPYAQEKIYRHNYLKTPQDHPLSSERNMPNVHALNDWLSMEGKTEYTHSTTRTKQNEEPLDNQIPAITDVRHTLSSTIKSSHNYHTTHDSIEGIQPKSSTIEREISRRLISSSPQRDKFEMLQERKKSKPQPIKRDTSNQNENPETKHPHKRTLLTRNCLNRGNSIGETKVLKTLGENSKNDLGLISASNEISKSGLRSNEEIASGEFEYSASKIKLQDSSDGVRHVEKPRAVQKNDRSSTVEDILLEFMGVDNKNDDAHSNKPEKIHEHNRSSTVDDIFKEFTEIDNASKSEKLTNVKEMDLKSPGDTFDNIFDSNENKVEHKVAPKLAKKPALLSQKDRESTKTLTQWDDEIMEKMMTYTSSSIKGLDLSDSSFPPSDLDDFEKTEGDILKEAV